ncbi:MAG: hypothetical protein QOF89_3282 [Acidobacteriota bacterium]|jgi:ADP-ribosylglycohydrolase/predicted enzyme related to lactoylglutathione lyase|nr:hypothetical protein [Acidobacteriota bacterium]
MNTSSDTSTPTVVPRAKAEGAFIALATGDALGWPQELGGHGPGKQRPQAKTEFRDWERRSGGRYYAHTEVVRAGEYSDDTQLTLAIARCRVHAGSGWWARFTRNELPLWTIYERGGGGATKRAAESWLRGVAPWKQSDATAIRKYFDAGGNGVAMRVIPHAVYCAVDDDPTHLLRDVVMDGAATHGHPRALVGATAYAYAAWWLLRSQRTLGFGELVSVLLDNSSTWGVLPVVSPTKNGWIDAANKVVGDYEKEWRQVVDEMRALLARVHDGLLAGALADDDEMLELLGAFGSAKGAGTVSTAAAVYLTARYAAQPAQGVLRAAFAAGADTDTIAAMAGGLLGALAGADWVPYEWFSVQDCQYLRQIANQVASRATSEEGEAPRHVTEKDLDGLIKGLLSGSCGDLDFGGTRRVRVIDFCSPVASSRTTTVQSWRLQASDGQTLYVTKLGRKSKDEVVPISDKPAKVSSKSVAPSVERKLEAHAAGVKLSVANLGASAGFYERVLCLPAIRKTTNFVSFGALSLVDGRYATDLSGGAIALDASVGRNRIEIYVSDLDAVQERLVQHKVRVARPITVLPWGGRSLHCLDPDGNVVELVERRSR